MKLVILYSDNLSTKEDDEPGNKMLAWRRERGMKAKLNITCKATAKLLICEIYHACMHLILLVMMLYGVCFDSAYSMSLFMVKNFKFQVFSMAFM